MRNLGFVLTNLCWFVLTTMIIDYGYRRWNRRHFVETRCRNLHVFSRNSQWLYSRPSRLHGFEVGGTNSGEAPEIFFSVPLKFALCPQFRGHSRGIHTTVEKSTLWK